MDTTFILNMFLLFGMCIVMAIMQRKGMLTANRFSLIVVAYISYFAISAIAANHLLFTKGDLEFGALLLLGIWIIVYPMARWIYRRWHSRNR